MPVSSGLTATTRSTCGSKIRATSQQLPVTSSATRSDRTRLCASSSIPPRCWALDRQCQPRVPTDCDHAEVTVNVQTDQREETDEVVSACRSGTRSAIGLVFVGPQARERSFEALKPPYDLVQLDVQVALVGLEALLVRSDEALRDRAGQDGTKPMPTSITAMAIARPAAASAVTSP